MTTVPLWRRRELLRQQALDRRLTGRPWHAGDYVQDGIGGEIRPIVQIASAGECLEAKAELIALAARTERPIEDRG